YLEFGTSNRYGRIRLYGRINSAWSNRVFQYLHAGGAGRAATFDPANIVRGSSLWTVYAYDANNTDYRFGLRRPLKANGLRITVQSTIATEHTFAVIGAVRELA